MQARLRKNKTAEKRRKKLLFRKYQYIWLGLIIGVFALAIFLFVKLGFYQKTINAVNHEMEKAAFSFSKSFGLIIKDIYVEGHKHTPIKKIKEKLKTKEGEPIILVSIQDVRAEIIKMEWVEDVVIERQIPSTLHVRIKEKAPVAIWQNKGDLALIDKKGDVISKNFISDFPGLPLVVGESANLNFAGLYETISGEKLFSERLSSLISVNGRRWNIRLHNGIDIMLPEKEPEKALVYLAKIHKKNKILDRKLKYIDMRLEDRLFIKPVSKPVVEEDPSTAAVESEKSSFDKVIEAIESIKKKKE